MFFSNKYLTYYVQSQQLKSNLNKVLHSLKRYLLQIRDSILSFHCDKKKSSLYTVSMECFKSFY